MSTIRHNDRFIRGENRQAKLKDEREEHIVRSKGIQGFIGKMHQAPVVLAAWQDQLWNMPVQQMVVWTDGAAEFSFKWENKITVRME